MDDEIQRLPEIYRTPFILYYLENRKQAEVARQLGIKEGTVWSRVAHARRLLQDSLSRRGVALAAVLSLLAVSAAAATTTVPSCLVSSVVRAATLSASGGTVATVVSAEVRALLQGAHLAMTFSKCKIATLVVLAVGVLGTGFGVAMYQHPAVQATDMVAPESPQDRPAPKPAVAPETKAREVVPGRKPAADLKGDPLPAGAVGRLGTLRFRHAGDMGAFALSPDGKRLASAADGVVVVWDAADGRELCRFAGHRRIVNSVAFSTDGKSVASGGEDNVIRLWDAATGKEVQSFQGHDGVTLDHAKGGGTSHGVYRLVFTPDGKSLVSRGVDQTARVWDMATGKELRRIDGLPGNPRALALSPDGKTLAAATGDYPKGPSDVRLYEVATGKELHRIRQEGVTETVAFSPDGRSLAAGWGANSSGGEVRRWETATGNPLASLRGHKRLVLSVAFSPDGKTLISGSFDGSIHLWDVGGAKEVGRVGKGLAPIQNSVFSPDGKLLLMQTGYVGDHAVRFWDVAGPRKSAAWVDTAAASPPWPLLRTAGRWFRGPPTGR